MGKLPILAKHAGNGCTGNRNSKGFCPVDRPLPVFYMVDYSVMGLLVDRFDEALRTLKEQGFSIEEGTSGIEVVIESPARVREVVRLLEERGIGCEMADVVGDMYQG